jgi:hypothetical protein
MLNMGTGGYCTAVQNIMQISGVASATTDQIVEALAADHAAGSILGLYRSADNASMIVIMEDRAQLNLTEMATHLGVREVRGKASSSHGTNGRVLIHDKIYDQPTRLGRAKDIAAGPLTTASFTTVAASALKTAKKVGAGLWLHSPIGPQDDNSASTPIQGTGNFPPLVVAGGRTNNIAKTGKELRKGGNYRIPSIPQHWGKEAVNPVHPPAHAYTDDDSDISPYQEEPMATATTTPSALSVGATRDSATSNKKEMDRAAILRRHQMEMEAYDAREAQQSSTAASAPRRGTTGPGDV